MSVYNIVYTTTSSDTPVTFDLDKNGTDSDGAILKNWIETNRDTLKTIKINDMSAELTTFQSMFTTCSALINVDLSNFDTNNIITFRSMFDGCTNLTTLDVSNFNTNNVTTMRAMFYNCVALRILKINRFNFIEGVNVDLIFGEGNYIVKNCTIYVKDEATKQFILNITGYSTTNTIIISPMAKPYIKLSGDWKKSLPWIKISGNWKKCTMWKKINGVWKKSN
jgi:surface protein